MLLVTLCGLVLTAVSANAQIALQCESQETKITSPWIYDNTKSCPQVVAELPDYYSEPYRRECQRWLGQADLPEKVGNAYVTECFTFPNGTIRYRAELCCEGVVTDVRCFTCSNVTVVYDTLAKRYDTYDCNHLGQVETCNTGEICQSTFKYIRKNNAISTLVTKSCQSASSCENLDTDDVNTCKNGITSPSCTECCDNTFCNWDHTISRIYIPGDACYPNPCYHNNNCTLDSTTDAGYTCTCRPSTWGPRCQYSPCSEKVCENEGYCRRLTFAPYYSCQCKLGYTGQNCSEEVDICSSDYCFNNGTCYDHGEYGLRCDCPEGFVGARCEMERPISCPAENGLAIPTVTYHNTVAHNCSSLDSYLDSRYRKPYLAYCRNHFGGDFQQGVDGIVDEADAVHLHSCNHGDTRTWYQIEVCCPACLAAPCENGGWCIPTQTGYTCQCRAGFEGKNCQYKVATCFVSGDPHYITFDGRQIHFQGTCKYNMTSSSPPGLTPFSVYVKHETRHGQDHVSYIRYLEVNVYGHVIRLGLNKVVMVDGAVVIPPYQVAPGVNVLFNGQFVRVETNFSLAVEFDGDWVGMVKVSPEYRTHMDGLCADFNDDASNDLTTSDGFDASLEPNKYSLVGNSWQVDDMEDPSCVGRNDPDPVECSEDMQQQFESNAYCGLLQDTTGPFASCINNPSSPAKIYMDNCLFDVCANQANPEAAKQAACQTLHTFATACAALQHVVDWRDAAQCPLACPEGMEYHSLTSACPATCSYPNAQAECHLPKTEGCQCPEGQLMQGNECVQPEDCGCLDRYSQIHEVGDVWLSDNCTQQHTCKPCTDCTPQVPLEYSEDHSCMTGYTCDNVNNVLMCTEIVVDPCQGVTCRNGGSCISVSDSFMCKCPHTHTGQYCETVLAIDGGWGAWSVWSQCSGDCGTGIQTRGRTCNKPVPQHGGTPCDGEDTEERPCVCVHDIVPDIDCESCTAISHNVGYLESKCNCSRYYQCFKKEDDSWMVFEMTCPPCQHWNHEYLTCVTVSDDCKTYTEGWSDEVTFDGDYCFIGDAQKKADPYSVNHYIEVLQSGEISRPCPAGTQFYFTECSCDHATGVPGPPIPPSPIPDPVTCITFDESENIQWGFSTSNWMWVSNTNVVLTSKDCIKNKCGYFDGNANLEVPFFANNLGGRKQFSVSMWYKRNGTAAGTQGLVNNKACNGDHSVRITSEQDVIFGTVVTKNAKEIETDLQVVGSEWNQVILSYNDLVVDLYTLSPTSGSTLVTTSHQYISDAEGGMMSSHCPMVIGKLLGEQNFKGKMDEICFYDEALTEAQVDVITAINTPP